MTAAILVGVPLLSGSATPQAATDPAASVFYRNEYYPGTETLGATEMRITALGTGNPEPRKSQASASWFVELGNGQKFFFDIGTGSQSNFPMLRVSYRDADKVFLSHLHTDHAGDLPELWIGGWIAGRFDRPLRVWGPSGAQPDLGTRSFIEHQKAAWKWDLTMRNGKLPAAGGEIEVHEFDFAKPQVVYAVDGVQISSFPVLHGMDGPVGYRLDWSGLSFVFSGDTAPTRFLVDRAQGVDVLVHESIDSVKRMIEIWGWDETTARVVGSTIHTQPAAAGRIFSMTKPRLAVGYHFFTDFEGLPLTLEEIRTTYAGPLALAFDGLVINVTKTDIKVRKLIGNEQTYPETVPAAAYAQAKRSTNVEPSKWLLDSGLKFDAP